MYVHGQLSDNCCNNHDSFSQTFCCCCHADLQVQIDGTYLEETKTAFDELNPKNDMSYSYMNTTVSALKKLLREQQEKGCNTHREDIVFGRYTTWIVKQAKKRKPIQDKKNYVEKIDASSAPMQAFDQVV